MYANTLDICHGQFGYIFMLTYDNATIKGKISKVQLHSPMEENKFVKTVKGP